MEWNDEYVWAYVEGELSADERALVDAELARNPARAREVAEMKQAMALLRREARAIARYPKQEMPEELAQVFQTQVLDWYRPPFAGGPGGAVGARAAASEDRGAWFRAQLSGGTAEIDVRVDHQSDGSPVLWISWNASFLPEEGWTLALKPDSDVVMRTFSLPPAKTGEWSASKTELGFDPRDVPFEIAWTDRRSF